MELEATEAATPLWHPSWGSNHSSQQVELIKVQLSLAEPKLWHWCVYVSYSSLKKMVSRCSIQLKMYLLLQLMEIPMQTRFGNLWITHFFHYYYQD